MDDLYEHDFYGWTQAQANAARRRSANELDWDRVAEELEALGRSEKRALFSHYVVLTTDLLKWRAQPGARSRSWEHSIRNARAAIAKILRESPGLQSAGAQEFADAYGFARRNASTETGFALDSFPEEPPFSLADAKREDWLPE